MYIWRTILLATGVLFFLSGPTQAIVSGRVVDATGKPIAEAMITYTDLKNRLIFSYSKSDGTFGIFGPSEWTIKKPGITDATGIYSNHKPFDSFSHRSRFDLVNHGSTVQITLHDACAPTIELMSLQGRTIRKVQGNTLSRGVYSINPFTENVAVASDQVYLVRVSDGNYAQTVKVLHVGDSHAMGSFGVSHKSSVVTSSIQAARAVVVDSLRIGKNYYHAQKKALESYSGNIGDIVLQSRDIEAEIDAILAGKDKAWKANVCAQGNEESYREYGTSFWKIGTAMSHADRLAAFNRMQTASVSASGIGKLVGNDAVHGFISKDPGTMFPQNINMGCSQNPELVELACRVVAFECQGVGINWTFAPCIDIVRNERHGRTYEGWDEGPEGTVKYVKYAVRGFQGTDLSNPMTIAATAKHFAGAGGTYDGIHKGICNTADYQTLTRIHLPGFRAACDAGVATVMSAFNSFKMADGQVVKMHGNKTLMTDTLKNAWGWKGFIVGDWMEAPNASGGVTGSYNAGLDNPMLPDNLPLGVSAAMAADDARITDAARRILRIKLLMNLKEEHRARTEYTQYVLNSTHREIARECVRRSIVLLKNQNNVLPLKASQKVHVIGEWGNSIRYQSGGWTLVHQGNYSGADPVGTTIKNAIAKVCPGATYSSSSSSIPADADVLVVVVGETTYAEDAGDRPSSNGSTLNLSAAHSALFTAAKAANKPVIGILLSGRPMIITNEIAKCDGFIAAFLPGPEGDGIADVMFAINNENFTAKLSHTWPASMTQIPINTGNFNDQTGSGGTPLFPYGFGLSY